MTLRMRAAYPTPCHRTGPFRGGGQSIPSCNGLECLIALQLMHVQSHDGTLRHPREEKVCVYVRKILHSASKATS